MWRVGGFVEGVACLGGVAVAVNGHIDLEGHARKEWRETATVAGLADVFYVHQRRRKSAKESRRVGS